MSELTRIVIAIEITDEHLASLQHEFPDIEFVTCPDAEELPNSLPGAQALIGSGIDSTLLSNCSELAWIQTYGAGVERLLFPELVESAVTITNVSGVHASNMAEHFLSMMLAFARGLPELIRHQVHGKWIQPLRVQLKDQTDFYEHPTFELGYQTLAIAGLGDVGCALAVRAKALGMKVIGSKRRSQDSPAGVDQLFGPSDWLQMLSEADHVAIALPLTRRTYHLFGEPEFQLMKPTAYIYNCGRGEIIDQTALVEALNSGEIAGAGLDVTTPEPLPQDSSLWYMPNVIVTSHTSGLTPHYADRAIALISENIRRFRDKQPLINIIDKAEGY